MGAPKGAKLGSQHATDYGGKQYVLKNINGSLLSEYRNKVAAIMRAKEMGGGVIVYDRVSRQKLAY